MRLMMWSTWQPQKGVVLVDEAIFADVIGAFGDLPPELLTHITGHEPKAGGHGPSPAA